VDDELPPHLAALTLEHYAALCAECTVHPEWGVQVQARYHVRSEQERALLDRHWRERMAADAALGERFRQLCAHYTDWVRQQPR
jgi:hypothetical protein